MTKVLMISTDPKILEEGSAVRARMYEYGSLFEELRIIVVAKGIDLGNEVKIRPNVLAYPTRAGSKIAALLGAMKIGSKILEEWKSEIEKCVITAQDPFETGAIGLRLSSKFKAPLHIQVHTDFENRHFGSSPLNRLRVKVAHRILPHADAIRVVSDRIKRSLGADLQKKTSVLPIFVDIDAIGREFITVDLRKKYPQFKRIALMASRLTKEKGYGAALRAFSEVARSYPGTGLVIVGSGPEEKAIKENIAKLGIEDSVVMQGWVDQHTLVSYMKTCDVFLSTSLYEGYGMSMLEARAAGAQIVATDAGIAEELTDAVCSVGDAACLYNNLGAALAFKDEPKQYEYPYATKKAYLDAFKADIERAIKR